jgi:hypothetical protein
MLVSRFEGFHAFDKCGKNVTLLFGQGHGRFLNLSFDLSILREVSLAALVMSVLHEMRGDLTCLLQAKARHGLSRWEGHKGKDSLGMIEVWERDVQAAIIAPEDLEDFMSRPIHFDCEDNCL